MSLNIHHALTVHPFISTASEAVLDEVGASSEFKSFWGLSRSARGRLFRWSAGHQLTAWSGDYIWPPLGLDCIVRADYGLV